MVVLSVFILLEILQNVVISYYLGQILWSEVIRGFLRNCMYIIVSSLYLNPLYTKNAKSLVGHR